MAVISMHQATIHTTNMSTQMKEYSIWLPYESVRDWVQRKGFTNYKQFRQYAKKHVLPEGVPACPQRSYGDDYISDVDFFGERAKRYVPFEVARIKARRMGFKTANEYREYCRKHEVHKPTHRLPLYPQRAYPREFVSWHDYLGDGRIANINRVFLPYKEARNFIHQIKIPDSVGWHKWANKSGERPDTIPSNPWDVYDEWNGMREWLGTNLTAKLQVQAENHSVLCFVQSEYDQPNEYSYAVFHGGTTQALRQCAQSGLRVVAIFKHEPEYSQRVADVISSNSSSHYDQRFVAFNIHEIMYELNMMLLRP